MKNPCCSPVAGPHCTVIVTGRGKEYPITKSALMKAPITQLLAGFLLMNLQAPAQVEWYQNQDAYNPPPYGTYASSVQTFSSQSFIACYQWQVNNDEYSWKISRTLNNGTEAAAFYVTGIMAQAEVRVKRNQSVYVLKKAYPYGQNPEYTVYRLNAALQVLSERIIVIPGDYAIINLNAFEIDEDGNVYLAGDGQYPMAGGLGFSSFVMKTGRNLLTRWVRMDSVQTSFTRIHIDRHQRVTVIEDYYNNYPQVKIHRFSRSGAGTGSQVLVPDAARYSLYSLMDKYNNLYFYGGKMPDDTTQAAYLCKVTAGGPVAYRQTYFAAPSSQLNDFRLDNSGRIFALATLYYNDGVETKITRINPASGALSWEKKIPFSTDSCQFSKLVINEGERFYAVGEKKYGSYFARGFALGMKKNGQTEDEWSAPDSVAWQRNHALVEGILDNDQRLIAVGNTHDFDTSTYSSSYFRAFAVRLESVGCGQPSGAMLQEREPGPPEPETLPRLFPNPVQDVLTISKLDPAVYDRLFVYDMRGGVVTQRNIVAGQMRLDLSALTDGVYLLVLRSSVTLKEKTIKFLVRK